MLALHTLKQLNEDAAALNEKLKEIVAQMDDQCTSLDGMRDISLRIRKVFELYRSLVNDMKTE